jgi:hypothetical protein
LNKDGRLFYFQVPVRGSSELFSPILLEGHHFVEVPKYYGRSQKGNRDLFHYVGKIILISLKYVKLFLKGFWHFPAIKISGSRG